MAASDVMINNTLDLSFEELIEFKRFTWDEKKLMVRNFATTASLLSTDWALTPHRLGQRDTVPSRHPHTSPGPVSG